MWKSIIFAPALFGLGVAIYFFIKSLDFFTSFGTGFVIFLICLAAAAIGYFKGSLSQKK